MKTPKLIIAMGYIDDDCVLLERLSISHLLIRKTRTFGNTLQLLPPA